MKRKRPSWCAKIPPCDFDPRTSYCVHSECQHALVAESKQLRAALEAIVEIAAQNGEDASYLQAKYALEKVNG